MEGIPWATIVTFIWAFMIAYYYLKAEKARLIAVAKLQGEESRRRLSGEILRDEHILPVTKMQLRFMTAVLVAMGVLIDRIGGVY